MSISKRTSAVEQTSSSESITDSSVDISYEEETNKGELSAKRSIEPGSATSPKLQALHEKHGSEMSIRKSVTLVKENEEVDESIKQELLDEHHSCDSDAIFDEDDPTAIHSKISCEAKRRKLERIKRD